MHVGAAPQQPPPSRPGALQELVPQEADESWLSTEPAGSEPAREQPAVAPQAADESLLGAQPADSEPAGEQPVAVDVAAAPSSEAVTETASGTEVPAAQLKDIAAAPPPAALTAAARPAEPDADADADDEEFTWSAAEPAQPAPESAAPEHVQPAPAPAQQQQQHQPAEAAVAQRPTSAPHGFALSLPKPPPGRQPRDVFASVSAAHGNGAAAPPVDIFAAQQPLFSSPLQPASHLKATAPAATAVGTDLLADAMHGDNDDDFGDFAAADANGVAAEQPQDVGSVAPSEPGTVAEQAAPTAAAAEAGDDDEFGDFEESVLAATGDSPQTSATTGQPVCSLTACCAGNEVWKHMHEIQSDAAAVPAAGEETNAAAEEGAAADQKEPEPERDPFADLF
jgi:hypothetical protein